MNDGLAIGVDLGATKIASVLATRAGEVIAQRQTATLVDEGAEAVIDRVAAEIAALRAAAPGRVIGAGIGSPGLIDGARGVVMSAVNMQWQEVALGPGVMKRLTGFPVTIENDANANAVGEGYFGSAAGSRDYVLLTVGSGLGAGVVSGGQLITGAHSAATDLGHISLDPDRGPMCRCGHRGCAEAVCSGPGLVAATRRLLAERSLQSALPDSPALTSAEILAAARSNDPAACAAISLLARWMGHVAAIAAAVTDPEVIVVGGGLGVAAADLIIPEMTAEYLRRAPRIIGTPTIRPATLTSSALGGASLVYSRLGT